MSSIHDKLALESLSLLTEEERRFWGGECARLPEYCFYPDLHLASQWEAPEKEAHYGRYCRKGGGACGCRFATEVQDAFISFGRS